MKNNLFYWGSKIFGGLFIFSVLLVLGTITASAAGICYAMATGAVVAAEPVSVAKVKAGSDLDRNYVSKKVVTMRPAATPLDTIMRNIENQIDVSSFRTEYYAVSSRDLVDTVASTYSTNNETEAQVTVSNPYAWTADDTCVAIGVTGTAGQGHADGKDVVLFVTRVNAAGNIIYVQALNYLYGTGGNSAKVIVPTLASGTRLVRCGTAKNELDAQTAPYGIVPVKDYNYLQIFMAQAEEGTFQKLHEKEVDFSFSDYEAQNIYDMRARMEYSFLFGYRDLFTDVYGSKVRYTTGGVTRYITTGLTYGTGGSDRTIDTPTVINWMKSIFTGNSGSDRRIMFMGDSFAANMMKAETVQRQLDAKKTEIVYGISFNLIESNFGQLLCKHHPLLDIAGTVWSDKAIVLDLNYIEKHTWKPMSVRQLDLKNSGQRNVVATVIEETSAVILRYPQTHAIIAPAT